MRIQGPSGSPPEPPEKQTYLTQPGDTLRSVSAKLNVNTEDLGNLNNIQGSIDLPLDAGRELFIPSKELVTGPENVATDKLEAAKDRLNPFDSSPIGDYWSEEQGPPWSEEGPWGEAPSWTEIAPEPDARLAGEAPTELPGTNDPDPLKE